MHVYVFDDIQQLFSLGTVTDTICPLFPAPTSGPEMLRIVGTSSTTIFIAWDAINCTERNSNITGYEVCYRPVNGASLNASISVADNLTYTASGLMVSTNYSFEVAAESSSGTGPFSSSVVARTGEFCFYTSLF